MKSTTRKIIRAHKGLYPKNAAGGLETRRAVAQKVKAMGRTRAREAYKQNHDCRYR